MIVKINQSDLNLQTFLKENPQERVLIKGSKESNQEFLDQNICYFNNQTIFISQGSSPEIKINDSITFDLEKEFPFQIFNMIPNRSNLTQLFFALLQDWSLTNRVSDHFSYSKIKNYSLKKVYESIKDSTRSWNINDQIILKDMFLDPYFSHVKEISKEKTINLINYDKIPEKFLPLIFFLIRNSEFPLVADFFIDGSRRNNLYVLSDPSVKHHSQFFNFTIYLDSIPDHFEKTQKIKSSTTVLDLEKIHPILIPLKTAASLLTQLRPEFKFNQLDELLNSPESDPLCIKSKDESFYFTYSYEDQIINEIIQECSGVKSTIVSISDPRFVKSFVDKDKNVNFISLATFLANCKTSPISYEVNKELNSPKSIYIDSLFFQVSL